MTTRSKIAANSAALPLGTVELGRSDYAAGLLGGNVRFGAAGTATTSWAPVATPFDRAASSMSTTAASESGAADRDF